MIALLGSVAIRSRCSRSCVFRLDGRLDGSTLAVFQWMKQMPGRSSGIQVRSNAWPEPAIRYRKVEPMPNAPTPWVGLADLVAMFVLPFLPNWLFEGPRTIRPRCGRPNRAGQPAWLVVSLGGLAVVAGLAVLAARRANRRARVGQRPNDRHGHALDVAAAPTGSPIALPAPGCLAHLARGPASRPCADPGGLSERIPSPLTLTHHLRKRRSAQRLGAPAQQRFLGRRSPPQVRHVLPGKVGERGPLSPRYLIRPHGRGPPRGMRIGWPGQARVSLMR
jgi:hypothetical protein